MVSIRGTLYSADDKQTMVLGSTQYSFRQAPRPGMLYRAKRNPSRPMVVRASLLDDYLLCRYFQECLEVMQAIGLVGGTDGLFGARPTGTSRDPLSSPSPQGKA